MVERRYILEIKGNRFSLGHGDQVGRLKENAVCLPEPSISKVHARFVMVDHRLRIEDLGSANGTYVNGQKIQAQILSHGDTVSFADISGKIFEERVPAVSGATSLEGAPEAKTPAYEPSQTAGAGAPAPKTLQERLKHSFDTYFMLAYRHILARYPLPLVLVPAVIGVFILLVILILSPQLADTQTIIREEGQKRALLLAKRVIDINRSFLDQNKDHLLTVNPILEETGVVEALIVKPDGKILAPEGRFGQLVSSSDVLRSLSSQSEYVSPSGLHSVVGAMPVFRFSQAKGVSEVFALGVVKISTAQSERGVSGQMVFWLQVGLLTFIAGMVLGLLFVRVFSQPWKDLENQIERAIQKAILEVPPLMNFDPVAKAVKSVNSLIYRSAGSESGERIGQTQSEPISLLNALTYIKVSEKGEIAYRAIGQADQEWVTSNMPTLSEAKTVNDLNGALGEWFKTQIEVLGFGESCAQSFDPLQCVCILTRQQDECVLLFMRLTPKAP
jgi:hypothetical protein